MCYNRVNIILQGLILMYSVRSSVLILWQLLESQLLNQGRRIKSVVCSLSTNINHCIYKVNNWRASLSCRFVFMSPCHSPCHARSRFRGFTTFFGPLHRHSVCLIVSLIPLSLFFCPPLFIFKLIILYNCLIVTH